MKIRHWKKSLTALLCALALLASLAPAALAAGFSDVPADHWAAAAIAEAADSGVTGGYADGTFRPRGEVTYAQFTAFLARAFYGSPSQSSSTPWYQTYLDAVKGDGLLSGTAASGGGAALDRPISRYDMALMMYRVMSAKGGVPDKSQRDAAGKKLGDWSAIPAAYRDAVAACAASGTLNGMSDGAFHGGEVMNRAQACAVISRMRQLLKGGAPAAPADVPASDVRTELVKLINAQRAQAGLGALTATEQMSKAAQARAEDLSGGYMEIRPDGSGWESVLEKNGVRAAYVDESVVVGSGYAAAAEALEVVLATPSAKEAMLTREYTHVGVGYVHTDQGYMGLKDFWSLLYIVAEDSAAPAPSAPSGDTGSLSYTPVPMKDLANKKSLQKKATEEQLAQAYAEAAKLVEPFAGLSLEQQLQGICQAVRDRFDNGMSYSMDSDHYNDPYGYFIEGSASCAGCTRATGLCLNILGIPYEHVHENQYTHQWCRVNVNGTYWICDPYGLFCGPEPAPYVHANPSLN